LTPVIDVPLILHATTDEVTDWQIFVALHESGCGTELARPDLRPRVGSRWKKRTRYAQCEHFAR
jgi:hypothetical protein